MKVDSSSNPKNSNNNNINENNTTMNNRITKHQTVFLKRPKRFVSNHDKFYLKAVKKVLSNKGMFFLRVTEAQKRNYGSGRRSKRQTTTTDGNQQDDKYENVDTTDAEVNSNNKQLPQNGQSRVSAPHDSRQHDNRSRKDLYLKPTSRNLAGYGRQMLMLLLQAAKLDTHCS